jgi:hypothetical protein
MPNGNPSFNLSEQEAWFAPLADTIMTFAHVHNLLLDKYYHESNSWDLRFNHPRGGQATITVSNVSADMAGVGSVWHLDDYQHFTRSLHWRTSRDIPKDATQLGKELEAELGAITSVPTGQWNRVATGYEKIWGQYSREEFERMASRFPNPIL